MGDPNTREAWQEMKDKNGEVYYFNKYTDETAWEIPDFDNPWKEMQDEDGDTYFYNTITKVTQWENPNEVVESEVDAMSISQSESDAMDTTEKEQLTPKEQFFYMLEKYDIDDTWTYESTVRKVFNDPLFKSLKTASERKRGFLEYISEHRDRLREKREKDFKRLYEAVKPIIEKLYTEGILQTGMSFSDFKLIFINNNVSKEIVDKDYLEKTWRECLGFLKQLEERERGKLKKDLVQFLNGTKDILLQLDMTWDTFINELQNHSYYTSNLSKMSLIDILDVFEDKMRKLELDQHSVIEKQKLTVKKQASEARNTFRTKLLELKHNNLLNCFSKWEDCYSIIKEWPCYNKVIEGTGSTPIELFWDIVEDEYDFYLNDKKRVINFIKDMRITIPDGISFEEFLSRLQIKSFYANRSLREIPSCNLKFIYESIQK